jgi:predicted TIM-barrel fold metal-dependent hydrolase
LRIRANIEEILELRARYPNVVLVIAHLGRSYAGRYAREGFPPLAEDPGILFDNSAVLQPGGARARAADRFGPERIMWASDHPIFYMRGKRLLGWRQLCQSHQRQLRVEHRPRSRLRSRRTYTLSHL